MAEKLNGSPTNPEEGVKTEVAAKPKGRRGVSNETRATTALKFHEKDCSKYGLFVGQLKEVLVDYRTLSEDTKGLSSFAGLAIPRLIFHFASCHNNDAEQRHVYQNLLPVESNIDTIPGGSKEWQINNTFAWIKHILDVFYLKGRVLTPQEEDALTLPFCDFDEQNEYVAVEPEEVLAGYASVFKAAADMLNGTYSDSEHEATGKPCYKDANGASLKIWMKLLRCKRVKGEWRNVSNGELAFDPFIGEGAIELLKTNMPPVILKLDLAKESITPQEVNKKPTIGAPGTPIGGMVIAPGMGGMPMGMPSGADVNAAFNEAGDDTPF